MRRKAAGGAALEATPVMTRTPASGANGGAAGYLKRLCWLVGGLAVSSLGIVMMLQANIGLEPWSVLQQGMAGTFGISYGTASAIAGGAVILAALLLGEHIGFGTLMNIVLCAVFIDALLALQWIPLMQSIGSGILLLLCGLELLAFGTWMYMRSQLGVGPRDALMVALSRNTGRSVGVCRGLTELLIVALGFLLGGQVGIGTVIAALGLGTLFNLNFAWLRFDAAHAPQETIAETLVNLFGRK